MVQQQQERNQVKRCHSALTMFPSNRAASKPLKVEQSPSRCTGKLPCYGCLGALFYTLLIRRVKFSCLYYSIMLVRSLSSPEALKLQT